MRIRRLLLKAFGPFTDIDVDLAAPPGAVNVIYGQNEAGKSSALRALEGFCFGIPPQSGDDHIHNYAQMQVGAELELADGTLGTFTRRKGKKNTLADGEGNLVANEDFERFLCRVEKSGFEALFCLSHERLTAAGEDILKEGGEIGKLLFAARSDVNLNSIQNTLAARTAALFRGTARSSAVIDDALHSFDAQKKIGRRGDLAEYRAVRQQLKELESRAEDLKAQLGQTRTERRALERRCSAAPINTKLKRVWERLGDLGDLPSLRDGFADEFATAKGVKLKADTTLDGARSQHRLVEERLSLISVDENLLAWRAEIERLNTQTVQMSSHLEDIPKERKKADDALAQAQTALAPIRPGEIPALEHLQIGPSERRISDLGLEKAALDQKLDGARKLKADSGEALADAQVRLQRTSDVQVPESLESALVAARALGDIEPSLAADRRTLADLEQKCDLMKGQLGGAARCLDEFVRLAPPNPTVIQELNDAWREAESDAKLAADALAQSERAHEAAQGQRAKLMLGGAIPSEEELREARNMRQSKWQGLRKNLGAETPRRSDRADLDAFEADVEHADDLSDRLRSEADRVAKLSSIELTIMEAAVALARRNAEVAGLRERQSQLKSDWERRWETTGLTPELPRQMIEWRTKFDALAEDAMVAARLRHEIEQRSSRLSGAAATLASALGPADADLGFDQLRQKADAAVRAVQKTKGLAEELGKSIDRNAASLRSAERSVHEIEARLTAWRDEWAAETQCLRLSRVPTPDEAFEAVKAISRAAERLEVARIAERRVEGMQRDFKDFAEATAKAAMAVGPGLSGVPEVTAVRNLYMRLGSMVELEVSRSELRRQQSEQAQRIQEAGADLTLALLKLEQLCREAGCVDTDSLESVVERHAQAVGLNRERVSLTEQIAEAAAGMPLEQFCAEVEAIDLDRATSQLEELAEHIEQLDTDLNEVNREIGRTQASQRALDEGNAQVESQILAEAALARVRAAVRPYLVYSTAECLVRAQIEEFRSANQGPILKKAGEIFAVLTDQSFSELTAELDDKDHPLLVAVRPSPTTGAEQRLKVDALSSATRMGLYLALRLACLHHHLEKREGLPFVADDILLDFDDARARRVMEELGRLSEKTQVILLTHHRHLVNIGREVLAERCRVQELPARR